MAASTELLLLGLLERQAMHGYELHEFLEHRLHFVTYLKKPTAYRMLERLYAQGLVERAIQRAGRRPERTVYHLTPQGRARLAALLREQLASGDLAHHPGNVALLFSDHVPPAERGTLLQQRRAALAGQRAALAEAVEAHAPDGTPRLVLEHDLALLDAELAWLDRLLAAAPAERRKEAPIS